MVVGMTLVDHFHIWFEFYINRYLKKLFNESIKENILLYNLGEIFD